MQKELDMKISTEQRFFNVLLDFNLVRSHNDETIQRAAALAKQLPQYSQWPNNPNQFWNAESLCWKSRIEKDVRLAIKNELSHLNNGRNLDLGSGSYSYVENSVVADFSDEMLLLNDAQHKVRTDLEKPLPFASGSFDSITMVFVASYIKNLDQLLNESKRVLAHGGKLVIVQPSNPVIPLHKMHYKNNYGDPELGMLLKRHGFSTHITRKKADTRELIFITAEKGLH